MTPTEGPSDKGALDRDTLEQIEASRSSEMDARLGERPLRVLLISSLWPNARDPNLGVFVENRMRGVQQSGDVRLRIVAPIPLNPMGRRDPNGISTPRLEKRAKMVIHHPRYVDGSFLGEDMRAVLYHASISSFVKRLSARRGPFDLIDSQVAYPDAVAASWIARALGAPYTITVRGVELESARKGRRARRQLREALRGAASVAAVNEDVRAALAEFGVDPKKVLVLRNGVDLEAFTPEYDGAARAALRARWNAPADAPLIVAAGDLIQRKRVDRIIDAIAGLDGVHLRVAGDGPLRGALEERVRASGAADRIQLLGALPHRELRTLYAAADATILGAELEGSCSVILESLACGAPVVSSPCWGARELLTPSHAGVVAREHSADALRAALRDVLAAPPARGAVRSYAERFSWSAVTRGILAQFRTAVARQG